MVNSIYRKKLINARKSGGDTPLHMAAEHGNIAIVRELIRAGANPDPYNNDHETPLFLAAKNNQIQVL